MANLNIKTIFLIGSLLIQSAFAYVPKNVIYWGQESDGSEQSLATYCATGHYDIIVIGFVYLFPTASGSQYPGMNFAGHCETSLDSANPYVLICPTIEADIMTCQSLGVQILLSFGGGVGLYGFNTDADGVSFANVVWNMFLGGNGAVRPFGKAIVDGVDLDIEGGSTKGYIPFIQTLRNYFATAPKNYYISSAPQCPYPDGRLGPGTGTALQSAWFDYVWVQFYNNYCGLNYYSQGAFNFDTWGNWAQKISINPNVKVFIGAPASANAAGIGYVPLTTLETISNAVMAGSYANVYGGIMLWDTSNSDRNNDFGGSVATYIHSKNIGGSTPSVTSTTGAKASVTTQKQSLTTATVKPATTASTTGVRTTGTTGVKSTSTSTTGVKSTSTSTTGVKSTSTSTTGVKSTSTSTTGVKPTSTSTSTTGVGGSPSDNSCVSGYMKCLTSETYSMCAHSSWGVPQSCQAGLVCSPTGNYIYCVRP